ANELHDAIAAYRQVLAFPISPYFDKALYKLAWSHYRADEIAEALRRFDELVVFSDAHKAGEGSELRAEAMQYLAISLAEPDAAAPRSTALDRARAFYRGREAEPHVR